MSHSELEGGGKEFPDPLQNYDPPQYDDPLLEALCEQPATAIQSQPCSTLRQDVTVREAVGMLAGRDIACLLITDEQQRLVGVFSDRDVLDKIALEYDQVQDRPVAEFMARPVFVRIQDSAAAAVGAMAATGYRHMPIVDEDGVVVGIISPQRTAAFIENYF